jgi:hypothetical protein
MHSPPCRAQCCLSALCGVACRILASVVPSSGSTGEHCEYTVSTHGGSVGTEHCGILSTATLLSQGLPLTGSGQQCTIESNRTCDRTGKMKRRRGGRGGRGGRAEGAEEGTQYSRRGGRAEGAGDAGGVHEVCDNGDDDERANAVAEHADALEKRHVRACMSARQRTAWRIVGADTDGVRGVRRPVTHSVD